MSSFPTISVAPPAQNIEAPRRIATLDGLRGIAILLVLFDHIQVLIARHYWKPWSETGLHGVTIFFVLSGYLITTNLLAAPNLRNFYIRRFFRLMPAAWMYLAALLFLDWAASVHATSGAELRSCLLFYRNYHHGPELGLAGHFWSLSIEAQFYFIWPSLLLLAGARRALRIAAVGAFVCAVFRILAWSHYDYPGPNFQTEVRADALLIGCLLALFLADATVQPYLARWVKWSALPAVALFFLCLVRFHLLQPLIESIAIAVIIALCVISPRHPLVRWTAFRPLAWLGLISYSVYLWQELFAHLPIPYIFALPLVVLGSYYWIERPCIRFARRLTVPSSPGRLR